MIKRFFSIILLTAGFFNHAAQPHDPEQIEGYQRLAPAQQVMADREPGHQSFVHEFAIRKAQAQTQFAHMMQRIYTDNSIAREMKRKYPGLTAKQLREHTHNEKEFKMNALGVAFLNQQLPEIPIGQILQMALTYESDFFDTYIKDRVDTSCCCTYPYDREGYVYADDGSKYGKWRHDTRYCCLLDCFCWSCCFKSCTQ